METIITTLLGALGVGLAAIAGWLKSYIAKSEVKHEKCEADKDALELKVNEIGRDVSLFRSCGTPDCGARAAMQRAQSFSISPHPPK